MEAEKPGEVLKAPTWNSKSKHPEQNTLAGSLITSVLTVPPIESVRLPVEPTLVTAPVNNRSSGEPLPPGARVSAHREGPRANVAAIKRALVQNAILQCSWF